MDTIQQISAAAEAIKSDAPQRFPAAASPGDTWRQGDLYVEFVSKLPQTTTAPQNPKLAPGNTKGSRHILDSLEGVTIRQKLHPNPLDGPILSLSTERTISHPEHGDLILPPGTYEISYQRAFAKELKRVSD